MTFEEARAQYPVLERLAYLNSGSVGPLSRAAVEAICRGRERDLLEGRTGKPYYLGMGELRARVRAALAAEIGVPATNVALTRATTDGCNVVLLGLGLEPEDEIVTTDGEHFGLLGALEVSGARVRPARVRDRPAAEALDAILAEVTPRTRLLALSHVSWVTGHVLPLAELKEATGLPVLVDGAQSVGAIPVDAAPFDWYTVSAQKWLCGPEPTGALYVRDPEGLAVACPTYFSQTAHEPDGSFVPQEGAARFDTGWIEPPVLEGLLAALEGHPPWRFERAARTTARARELLDERYEVVTEPGHATLVSVRWTDGDPAEAAARAFERGVAIRDLPGTSLLRVSCGYWTSDDELARLVAALESA